MKIDLKGRKLLPLPELVIGKMTIVNRKKIGVDYGTPYRNSLFRDKDGVSRMKIPEFPILYKCPLCGHEEEKRQSEVAVCIYEVISCSNCRLKYEERLGQVNKETLQRFSDVAEVIKQEGFLGGEFGIQEDDTKAIADLIRIAVAEEDTSILWNIIEGE